VWNHSVYKHGAPNSMGAVDRSGDLYIASDNGTFHAIAPDNGTKWTFAMDHNTADGGVALGAGWLVFMDDVGVVYKIGP